MAEEAEVVVVRKKAGDAVGYLIWQFVERSCDDTIFVLRVLVAMHNARRLWPL